MDDVRASRLTGLAAMVTGAASGIGEATVHRLAAEGAAVMIVDVDEAGAARVADELTAQGASARWTAADVRSRREVKAAIDATVSAFGRFDVLHNNAGIGPLAPLVEQDEASVREILAINLEGVINGIIAGAPVMIELGNGGSIINTASAAAHVAAPLEGVYSASKAGVIGITQTVAREFAPDVRVNSISPGSILTPMATKVFGDGESLPPGFLEAFGSMHMNKRHGRPEEIAAAVAFLASPDASLVTATDLRVDGGLTMMAPVDPREVAKTLLAQA